MLPDVFPVPGLPANSDVASDSLPDLSEALFPFAKEKYTNRKKKRETLLKDHWIDLTKLPTGI